MFCATVVRTYRNTSAAKTAVALKEDVSPRLVASVRRRTAPAVARPRGEIRVATAATTGRDAGAARTAEAPKADARSLLVVSVRRASHDSVREWLRGGNRKPPGFKLGSRPSLVVTFAAQFATRPINGLERLV